MLGSQKPFFLLHWTRRKLYCVYFLFKRISQNNEQIPKKTAWFLSIVIGSVRQSISPDTRVSWHLYGLVCTNYLQFHFFQFFVRTSNIPHHIIAGSQKLVGIPVISPKRAIPLFRKFLLCIQQPFLFPSSTGFLPFSSILKQIGYYFHYLSRVEKSI